MPNSVGTPHTLKRAVEHAIADYMLKTRQGGHPHLDETIVKHVVDFANQQFGKALLKAENSPTCVQTIEDLYAMLTKGNG